MKEGPNECGVPLAGALVARVGHRQELDGAEPVKRPGMGGSDSETCPFVDPARPLVEGCHMQKHIPRLIAIPRLDKTGPEELQSETLAG